VGSNTGVSILLADILGGLAGFFVSTVVIVMTGEIIPQAICSRYAMVLSSATIYVVYVAMVITFVIAYPISAILDKILGKEEVTLVSKSKMKKMFEMYEKENLLKPFERKILSMTLEL
jgi:metal transporter CNNM